MARDELELGEDEQGFPLLLAVAGPKAPGQVAAQPTSSGAVVARGAASGNPNADPANGRFAPKSGGNGSGVKVAGDINLLAKLTDSANTYIQQQIDQNNAAGFTIKGQGKEAVITLVSANASVLASFTVPTTESDQKVQSEMDNQAGNATPQRVRSSVPQGVDPAMWQRRVDAVREAARELDKMSDGDAKDFLKGRVADVSQVDIPAFLHDVQEQRLDDLSDILDNQLRSKVAGMRRSRRFVTLKAPKGWTQRVFNGLDDNGVVALVKRLEGRGWDPKDLQKYIIGKVQDETRRTKLEQAYGSSQKKPAKGGSKSGK